MTAEIAVFNKSAVALAADSAVTISGGGKHKIYNGAEKLFALTKHHPVGVMVYGSGDLCSAPWELVIKAYRKKLERNHFDTLEDYAADFFDFLEESTCIVTPGMREGHLYQYLSEGVFNLLIESFAAKKEDAYWNPLDRQLFFTELEAYCQELMEHLAGTEFLDSFSDTDLAEAREYCNELTVRIVAEKLSAIPTEEIPNTFLQSICNIFAAMICKVNDLGNVTGIVFAGYGETDYYPKVLSYNVCGFFNAKVRRFIISEKCSANGESGVTPFAQDEEVGAFLQGASSTLIGELHNEYQNSIRNLLDGIDGVVTRMVPNDKLEETQGAIVELVRSTVAECDRRINDFVHENYVRKVVDMIKFLPKQDLAYMAESLVNLTAFKRKVSDDSETVGGPIDVAVISKADGFIWVKRKHYFAQDLNHHYFARS
ncbi:hypothetical protein KAG03_15105 [Klebsiella variicola]|uniref:hypothetical protein n=1 Tax=Klebsiella variicola TaxID=244366 RepID=UPI0009B9CD39|nr:hypothetical protein [Klebsiella variicola]HCI5736049.1 hypothetical protein [Klebsiella variicola subsp. variicola]MCB7753774.1 hypothetical protein [Klebsiella variicola]SLY93121.1 Uncharacterised protein [Klebsiella variicola]SXF16196.1 Uncharacterised protein [Klebsiella variicola]SXF90062.1 Uncharacterised protein [Klebsiella variicola]